MIDILYCAWQFEDRGIQTEVPLNERNRIGALQLAGNGGAPAGRRAKNGRIRKIRNLIAHGGKHRRPNYRWSYYEAHAALGAVGCAAGRDRPRREGGVANRKTYAPPRCLLQ